jgi:penicillin G amidase
MQRPILRLLAVLLFLASSAIPAVAQQADTLRVAGLREPVEILRDAWGIPHIYAQNEQDLFFAQGYNAARDRLFQFEVWRRQATGTVAEILGPRELKRDIGARLFRFRGDLSAELSHYHPRGEEIIHSFVRGVNSYIEETERNPDLLPLEFQLLGIRPGRWTADVVVSRHQGLIGNVRQELDNARAVALLGPEPVASIGYFEPRIPDLTLDPKIDARLLFDDILELYNAFRGSVVFRPEDVVARFRGDAATFAALAPELTSESDLPRRGESIGSNNWVVSGALTSSGHPIMANDPHRAIGAPSLRYWAHLVAPGWNVIGGGEPVLPGISIGHNEFGAWGLTIFQLDSEDLYIYDIDPMNPDRYRYGTGWEEMRIVRESIPVRGQEPAVVELKYTRHGPVVYEDLANRKAYAVRAGWLEIGGAPYLASLRMNQARNWEEFVEACTYSHIPGENMVWADVHGDIGWQAVGISPVRRNWNGLLPVPGDGSYEWDSYLPIRELPSVLNPATGFWGNGNDFVVPRSYTRWDAITFAGWTDPFRGDRVREMLGSGRRFTVADMMAFQHDELSIPARTLVPILVSLEADQATTREALQWLRGWDHVLDQRSVAAGIYVEWERRLLANLRGMFIPAEARPFLSLSMTRSIDWLLAPDGRFGPDPIAGRNTLMLRSLDEAVQVLTEKLGPEMGEWAYGQERYKHSLQRHPLSAAVSPEVRARLDVGPLPRGGYNYTVKAAGTADNQTSGASFRIIAPIADWDLAVGTQTPGQSGDPAHRHYQDLFPLWASDQYFPVFFSREKVESVTREVMLLTPG